MDGGLRRARSDRFAFHDPLDDLAADPALGGTLPGCPVADRATYTVVGWWSRGERTRWTRSAALASLTRAWQSWGGRCSRAPTPPPPRPATGPVVAAEKPWLGARALTDLGVAYAGAHGTAVDAGRPSRREGGVRTRAARRECRRADPVRTAEGPAAARRPRRCCTAASSGCRSPATWPLGSRPPSPAANGAAATGLGEHLFDALGALAADRVPPGWGRRRDRAGRRRAAGRGVRPRELQRWPTPRGRPRSTPASTRAGSLGRERRGGRSRPAGRRAGGPCRADAGSAPSATNVKGVKSVVLEAGATRYEASARSSGRAARPTRWPVRRRRASPRPRRAARERGVHRRVVGHATGADRGAAGPAPMGAQRPLARRSSARADRCATAVMVAGPERRRPAGPPPEPARRSTSSARCTARTCSPHCRRAPCRPRRSDLAREALLLSPHLASWLAAAAPARRAAAPPRAYRAPVRGRARCATTRPAHTRPRPTSASPSRSSSLRRQGSTRTRRHRPGTARSLAVRRRRPEPGRGHGLGPAVVADVAGVQVDVLAGARGGGGWQLGQTDLRPEPRRPEPPTAWSTPAAACSRPRTGDRRSATPWPPGSATRTSATGRRRRDRRRHLRELSAAGQVAGPPTCSARTLDGVRRALLGLPRRRPWGQGRRRHRVPLTPAACRSCCAAGELRVLRARLLDAFGRLLDLPVDAAVPRRLAATAGRRRPGGRMLGRRGFSAGAGAGCGWSARQAARPTTPVDAKVDEADPAGHDQPGRRLPAARPRRRVAGGLRRRPAPRWASCSSPGRRIRRRRSCWETAPGRRWPGRRRPGEGLRAASRRRWPRSPPAWSRPTLRARAAAGSAPGAESALSALLRAIDTTLWTVDTVAGAGSAEVAAIVGRPVAVVRAVLELDVADDLDSLTLDATARAARAAAYAELAAGRRRGAAGRDDPARRRPARVVPRRRLHARPPRGQGRRRPGPRGRARARATSCTWGQTPTDPAIEPITHPYSSPTTRSCCGRACPRHRHPADVARRGGSRDERGHAARHEPRCSDRGSPPAWTLWCRASGSARCSSTRATCGCRSSPRSASSRR